MSFENFPASNTPEQKPLPPKKNNFDTKTILTAVLVVALLGTWGYMIWDKNKTSQQTQTLTTQVATSDSSRNQIQTELNDALGRLDMLKTSNSRADSLLKTKDKDIQDLKARVQTILNNKNATAAELSQARSLIAELKNNIGNYTAEIEKLQGEKIKLVEEKRVVTEDRDRQKRNYDSATVVIKDKDETIDIGSTLHASNFNIVGVKERNNNKEKITTTAKRVDKLKISFDIDENRITSSGAKDIFVCISAPDGSPVAVEALGSGKFVTRAGNELYYTKKVQVDYKQGERQQVNVEWMPNSNFQSGNYRIEVYNNGFKIGEGIRTFKKGGLFS